MANTINDLRSHLFETLAALKNKETPMDLDRAQAVADVAKVIIESAKVEVSFLKVTGATQSTGFLPAAEERTAPAPVAKQLPAQRAIEGDRCVLCDCRLTTPYSIERGLCGSCSDRPEARHLKPRKSA